MKKNILSMAVLLMASATVFTACSSDDNIISEQPAQPTDKYTMTINASKGGDTANSRTSRALSLSGKTLNVKWAATDEVSVFPESMGTDPMGTLTAAASETGSTTLTGDLTSAPSVGDKLNLLFPRATWNYTGQTGVLLSDANSIEKKYDYALAEVEVAEVNGNTITTTGDANFASQQAIVKFILKNKSDNSSLNASSLTISAASNKLVKGIGNYTKSTTHSGYTVTDGTGGFNDNESHTKLLDDDKGTKWCANGPWNVTFNTASPVQVDGYTLTTGNDTGSESGRNPKSWTLKGKLNESDEWTTIATVTDDNTMPAANTADVDFVVDNPGSYKYFYFEVTANQDGNIMQLAELQLWAGSYSAAYGDLTVTPASATSEMTVALRNENAGSDTYTLTANVGGSNYTYEKSDVTFQKGKYYEITVKMAAPDPTVTLIPEQIGNLTTDGSSNTINGITIAVSGDAHFYSGGHMDVQGSASGPDVDPESITGEGTFTFTSSVGKIKRIDINHENGRWSGAGDGWPASYDVYGDNNTFTWSGTPAGSVTLNGSQNSTNHCDIYYISSIVFTLEQ